MVELSAEQFAQRAFDLNLIDERQLQELWGTAGSRELTGDDFRQLLLRRELLTNYQVERLLRGDRSGFFYGDYKVLYLIGTGTFARVYRAIHKTTGETVAVKVLRKRFAEDPEQAERFQREGEMGATLRHPNIVPIFEVSKEAGTYYLVMDFIEGRNLREFIKIRKKFDAMSATRICTDIASGLAYAFERGICHRDLKMSNVLVSSRGQAKLVDFGLAAADKNLSDEAIAENPNPRTIDYAGLERATGVRKDDSRSDIYFLGCIYYHLLTGQPPIYETKDRIQRLSKTRYLEVMPISKRDAELPRAVTTVVNKAMELDVGHRYQSPAEMLDDLKLTIDRLNNPAAETDEEPLAKPNRTLPSTQASSAAQRTLMFVDSNVSLQNVFRERLKTSGYRVLVTQDPQRALSRFDEDPKAAELVIFSTSGLGEAALEAFNQFGQAAATKAVPAIILIDETHRAWKHRLKADPKHVGVLMPVKLKQLRQLLAKLLPAESPSNSGVK